LEGQRVLQNAGDAEVELMCRLLLTAVVIAAAAAPVFAGDEQDCFQSLEPQLRIKGCSVIIQRAPKDATAYHNRAAAFGLAGDIDNAIADYTKTIEIAPDNASAYENRARAYSSKGDYSSALADVIKASELLARATAEPTTTARKTLTAPKSTKKTTPKASKDVGKDAPSSSWWSWSWPWDGVADQASGKKAKP
jgi:tetratricopeptide (TPR) repeat protein